MVEGGRLLRAGEVSVRVARWRRATTMAVCALLASGVTANITVPQADGAQSLATIPSPYAVTSGASVGTSSARLAGYVYSGGKESGQYDTRYRFEYGPTASYGLYSGEGDAGSEIEGQPVTMIVTGLSSASTYHFRIVAWNSKGTYYGADASLRTAGPSVAPSAVVDPITGRNAFYAAPSGKIADWWVNNDSWEDVEFGNGESVAGYSSPSAVYEPSGSGRNAFYVGAGGTIWDWYVNSGRWENVELGTVNGGGANEPAQIDTSPSAVYEPGSGRNVFYEGANGKIWDWWLNGSHWEDREFAGGESPAIDVSPSAVYEPSGSGRNAFYVGADGTIWDWYVNSGRWENVELGTVNGGGANEPAAAEAGSAAVYESGSGRNVFYEGANGKIWDWWRNGSHWEDREL